MCVICCLSNNNFFIYSVVIPLSNNYEVIVVLSVTSQSKLQKSILDLVIFQIRSTSTNNLYFE